jgi:lipopolysaccharide/colanic/teichoic acid biosynthesis glycosyltransferase
MYKDSLQLKIRRTLDFFFSFFILMLLSPILLIIAIAIRLEDGGSIFISKEMTGANGHRFPVYKFRTMHTSHESEMISLPGLKEQEGPVFKIMNDPKVTRIGRLLRKTSFDELPQFFNVVRGEISVVGIWPHTLSKI